jgi:sulfatase-like protein
VNFHDTHFPYTHRLVRPLVDNTVLDRSEISPGKRDELWRMYLNTAANVDDAIGNVLDAVRRTTGREPAVIVTADHGESLFEDGFLGHGFILNEAQTRIPLVVSGLPMTIGEPWGQVQLRDELREALARPPATNERPHGAQSGADIFQYLGELGTAAQIGFANPRGQTTYDFRSDLFQMPGHPALRPSELDEKGKHMFLELVHFWEGMMVASTPR